MPIPARRKGRPDTGPLIHIGLRQVYTLQRRHGERIHGSELPLPGERGLLLYPLLDLPADAGHHIGSRFRHRPLGAAGPDGACQGHRKRRPGVHRVRQGHGGRHCECKGPHRSGVHPPHASGGHGRFQRHQEGSQRGVGCQGVKAVPQGAPYGLESGARRRTGPPHRPVPCARPGHTGEHNGILGARGGGTSANSSGAWPRCSYRRPWPS